MSRPLLIGLGWVAVSLALVGVVLPGLPTTVFVLAASWCFARSSPRFERWLRGHAWLSVPLRRFAGSGGMPRSAKRLALGSMWFAVTLSALALAGLHPYAALVTIALGVVGTLAIVWVVPTASEPPVARLERGSS
jgi:uncharacterized membrane protein YbaN (DUF454 family)